MKLHKEGVKQKQRQMTGNTKKWKKWLKRHNANAVRQKAIPKDEEDFTPTLAQPI